MSYLYVQVPGAAILPLKDLERIAESHDAASLIAVDGISITDIAQGKATLPPKKQNEKRTYIFYIDASSQEMAGRKAHLILEEALKERDKPVYDDLTDFLKSYQGASRKEQVVASVEFYETEPTVLLIYIPAKSDYEPAKIYYRGGVAYACLEILEHFTGIKEGK